MSSPTPSVVASTAKQEATQATVFGLHVQADCQLRLLAGACTTPTGRSIDLSVERCSLPDSVRPPCDEVICSRSRGGVETFRIATLRDGGYLLWGSEGGGYRFSRDARRASCEIGRLSADRWERFLLGQALPFASLLAGLEVFHASAVVFDGRAVAFAGPSGAGKSSIALAMCDLGADFLADDVLALELRDGDLLAHSGAPVLSILHREAERRRAAGLTSAPTSLAGGRTEQLIVMPRPHEAKVPLGTLFFLERRPRGPARPYFEVVTDPQRLLGATFNFALATAGRLRGLLDVCALVSRRRVERIVVDAKLDASTLATAVARRLSGTI
jgi:hypothetical protein